MSTPECLLSLPPVPASNVDEEIYLSSTRTPAEHDHTAADGPSSPARAGALRIPAEFLAELRPLAGGRWSAKVWPSPSRRRVRVVDWRTNLAGDLQADDFATSRDGAEAFALARQDSHSKFERVCAQQIHGLAVFGTRRGLVAANCLVSQALHTIELGEHRCVPREVIKTFAAPKRCVESDRRVPNQTLDDRICHPPNSSPEQRHDRTIGGRAWLGRLMASSPSRTSTAGTAGGA